MALRDQPYLPLYVQDFLTDEKLNECSAASTGVYIRLMCIMHKSEQYGKIELKAKHKQTTSKYKNIAIMLERHMPYTREEIETAVIELSENGVVGITDSCIFQKRMLRDAELSEKRANSGSKGGKARGNSHTKKLYNQPGYIYIIGDEKTGDEYKVGISKDPKTRLLQLRRSTSKDLNLLYVSECNDMGTVEDNVLAFFDEQRDGEWIYGVGFSEIKSKVIEFNNKQIPSKPQANTENENENDIDSEDINVDKGLLEEAESNPRARGKERKAEIKAIWDSHTFSPELGKAVKAWGKYKLEKRQEYKPEGLKSLLTQVQNKAAKYGDDAVIELIRQSMAANWQGIAWDKLQKWEDEAGAANRGSNQRDKVSPGDTGRTKPTLGTILE